MAPAACNRHALLVGALLLIGMCSHGARLTADEQPAGPAELERLAQQILAMHHAMDELQVQLDGAHAQERVFLEQTATQLLGDWRDPAPTAEPALSDVPAWYLDAWQRHSGFTPLQPLGGWQRSWLTLRATERPLYDRYEELAVACHRLEHLHERLLRQLQADPGAVGTAAWEGPPAATLLPAP